jgi:ribosomal protein S27E
MVLADVEPVGSARRSSFATVICRDCAFAIVVRSTATAGFAV